ncbi:MAG: hypothetical protein JWQ49_441 [Edaphobacter sp.]|nr:hypothetical protein [Edaphobacter sp.]
MLCQAVPWGTPALGTLVVRWGWERLVVERDLWTYQLPSASSGLGRPADLLACFRVSSSPAGFPSLACRFQN